MSGLLNIVKVNVTSTGTGTITHGTVGKTDPAYISGLMADAKARSMRSLFGRVAS